MVPHYIPPTTSIERSILDATETHDADREMADFEASRYLDRGIHSEYRQTKRDDTIAAIMANRDYGVFLAKLNRGEFNGKQSKLERRLKAGR